MRRLNCLVQGTAHDRTLYSRASLHRAKRTGGDGRREDTTHTSPTGKLPSCSALS